MFEPPREQQRVDLHNAGSEIAEPIEPRRAEDRTQVGDSTREISLGTSSFSRAERPNQESATETTQAKQDGFFKGMRFKFREWVLDKFINFYPPFLGAGIKVTNVDPDYRTIDVRMKLTALNKNYVGTQYGGSLYSMCDPFYMLMLIKNLGNEYVVWDKAASIQFKRPGRGAVHATFKISQEQIDRIKANADKNGKTEETFSVDVLDDDGQVVATVEKLLHVRKKKR
jgi:acyl-coenzyme A thioesterase PaaI-like protein